MKGESMDEDYKIRDAYKLHDAYKLRDAIGDALIDADKRGAKGKNLRLVIAKDAYELLSEWQAKTQDCNVISWERFVKGYKQGMTNVMLCGVKIIPAEWGTGWTLYEKRKGNK